MSVDKVATPFYVENLFTHNGDENEMHAARRIEEAVCILDTTRQLAFSFYQGPVYAGYGGAIGEIPAFRVIIEAKNMEAYKAEVGKKVANKKLMAATNALGPFLETATRMFYQCVHSGTHKNDGINSQKTLKDIFSFEELRKIDTAFEQEYIKSSQTSNVSHKNSLKIESVNSEDQEFQIQEMFWAKSGFEVIAKKVAMYVCERLDPTRILFYPFHVDSIHNGQEGTVGEIPTFMTQRHFVNLCIYQHYVEEQLQDPQFIKALSILAVCRENFTRQFWVHQMN